MNSQQGDKKKARSLVRQNTFSLDKSEAKVSKNLGGVSRLGILDRADTMCKLSPEVREYLSAHLTMMIEETDKLMRENEKLKTELESLNEQSKRSITEATENAEEEIRCLKVGFFPLVGTFR